MNLDVNKIDLDQLAQDFTMDSIKWYDKEYFIWFVKSVVLCRDVKQTGIPFRRMYKDAKNFMLVKDKNTALLDYRNKGQDNWDCIPTHLLHGEKYYLCWTYSV
tara:strand:- start:1831 stop:2139 length:309 start_codon:yes stop_codon:yes gene_type:complete